MTPVASDDEVRDLAFELAAAGGFALDLEFASEGRYVPDLGLVQVAWGDPESPRAVAVDPLACDASPLLHLVADPGVETVLHGGSSDLALLSDRFGVVPAAVVDTQIAAAFSGYGDQVGYGALVERLLRISLDKGARYTDWLRRPLADDQLRYALDDARHLWTAWHRLARDLEARGRLDWVRAESGALARRAATRPPPEEAWRKVSGTARLRPRALGIVRALAAWREERALETNTPPSWILPDRALLGLAERPPRSLSDLERSRGLPQATLKRHGREVFDVLAAGASRPLPQEEDRGADPELEAAWAPLLAGLVAARAKEEDVAARFLATRRDLGDLISWFASPDGREPPAVLTGWRRDLVGEALLEVLSGRRHLALDRESPGGLRLLDPAASPPPSPPPPPPEGGLRASRGGPGEPTE